MRGTSAWILHRLTGLMLAAGLSVHFVVMHFSGPGKLTYEAVAARLSELGWVAFNLAFMVSALFHGFNGLWGMAIEYLGAGAGLRVVQALIVVAALALGLVGVYIIII